MTLPKGLYDLLISPEVDEQLQGLGVQYVINKREVKGLDRKRRLIADLSQRISDMLESLEGSSDYQQLELATINKMLRDLHADEDHWESPIEALISVNSPDREVSHPSTGLHQPWLFAAGKNDIGLLSELRAELSSADHVDILISFIKWEGVRRLMDLFQAATAIDATGTPRTKFRIITSTYIGATEERAVSWLARLPGVSVKVSLDGRRTRLHAKAWIFRRATKFGSAYVGSANLSAAALTGGLEWTIKVTESGQRDVYEKSIAHFETLWADPEFQAYDPNNESHVKSLKDALQREKGRSVSPSSSQMAVTTWFDIEPKPFQQVILDRLHHERLHKRFRNLVIAATGTGKTVIAALDYRRICKEEGGKPRLLFVAHRQEILKQALETYRQVLRDPHFGEILADGNQPLSKEHLFATIQSVLSRDLLRTLGADYWRIVVIDECHHVAANSFKDFALNIKPKYLLGLTATPERGDGDSIAMFFDARPDGSSAAELRLWDALDQQLLSPFEYYGINDPTDFTDIPWGKTAQEKKALNLSLLNNEKRARVVSHAVETYVDDMSSMRALGFCVSVEHAMMMTDFFSSQGIPSVTAHGNMDADERNSIRKKLESGDIRAVFSCDLYNEGIDLPYVNTILLLRPTDSPVVFTQQLGRGLRLWPSKSSCLVLDFIGQYSTAFRFERLWRSITGLSKRELLDNIDKGFSNLPPGCVIHFDKQSGETVLENLKATANQRWSQLANELRAYHALKQGKPYSMTDFIRDQFIDIEDIYRSSLPTGWTLLCNTAGITDTVVDATIEPLLKRLPSLLHHNDPIYLDFLSDILCKKSSYSDIEKRQILMLGYQLVVSGNVNINEIDAKLRDCKFLLNELSELANLLNDSSEISDVPISGAPALWPLILHARYSRSEIIAAVGKHSDGARAHSREGVLRLPDQKIELLFVTLDKSKGFHDQISYRDYAVSPTHFHWETQNSTRPDSAIGQQYLNSPGNGWHHFLFVRSGPNDPYFALGQVCQESISGSQPMSILWKLEQPMTIELFQKLSILRG